MPIVNFRFMLFLTIGNRDGPAFDVQLIAVNPIALYA
jgi:hypothetical protein